MTKIKISKVYQGVDLAISKASNADYFVTVTIGLDGNGRIFILDVFRQQGVSFQMQINTVITKAATWQPLKIGVESNAYQASLSQELARLTLLPIIELTTVRDKVMRAQQRSALVESGRVYVHPSMSEVISEFVLLPDGDHDDIFDGFDFALTVSEAPHQNATGNYFIPEFESDRYWNQP